MIFLSSPLIPVWNMMENLMYPQNPTERFATRTHRKSGTYQEGRLRHRRRWGPMMSQVVSHGGTGDPAPLQKLDQSHPKAGRKRWKSWKVTPSADLGWSQIPSGNLLISQPQEKPCKKRGKWPSLPNLTPRAEVPAMVWFITWRTTIWQSWLNLHPTRRNHK